MNHHTVRLRHCGYWLALSLLFTACTQPHPKAASKKVVNAAPASSALKSTIVKGDTALICVADTEAGVFDPEKGNFDDFVAHKKGYFKGKKELSDNYVRKHLFSGLDSVPIENPYMGQIVDERPVDEYIANTDFYLITTALKTPRFKGIIYEEIGDEGSRKFFSTIDRNGKFISRLIIAAYEYAGTYTEDADTRHGYYSGMDGCISKDLVIDMGGGEDDIYKVHPDGKIVKYMREYYDSVLLVHPNDADLHLRYARYLRDRYEKDYPGAKRQFENVLKIDPTVAVATNEYAYLLWLHFNDTTEANLYFKKAIELAPKVRQFRSDYKFFLNRHVRDEKTRKGYEKALKLADSNNFGMHLDYARFLLKIDWKQEARRHYLKAVALNKNLKNKKDDDLFGIE